MRIVSIAIASLITFAMYACNGPYPVSEVYSAKQRLLLPYGSKQYQRDIIGSQEELLKKQQSISDGLWLFDVLYYKKEISAEQQVALSTALSYYPALLKLEHINALRSAHENKNVNMLQPYLPKIAKRLTKYSNFLIFIEDMAPHFIVEDKAKHLLMKHSVELSRTFKEDIAKYHSSSDTLFAFDEDATAHDNLFVKIVEEASNQYSDVASMESVLSIGGNK